MLKIMPLEACYPMTRMVLTYMGCLIKSITSKSDLIGSLGGLELESDLQKSSSEVMSKMSLSVGGVGNVVAHYGFPNGVGTVAGEHPSGEHPSRTLLVRNINCSVEDSELRTLLVWGFLSGHVASLTDNNVAMFYSLQNLWDQCKSR